nr:hypothetical protein [Actinophytocola xanthii]
MDGQVDVGHHRVAVAGGDALRGQHGLWHAAAWSSSDRLGRSARTGATRSQRGANEQPGGRSVSSGGWPAIGVNAWSGRASRRPRL